MSRHSYHTAYLLRSANSDCSDLFAVNPLRRSAWIVSVSLALLVVPAYVLDGEWKAIVLISTGWLAATGIILCTPIMLWCLLEEAWKHIRRRVDPGIDLLDLSPRAFNLLRRHGFESISSVDSTSDASLMLLSNMDARTLHEIRRAINLWQYQRWQERGFPADGMP